MMNQFVRYLPVLRLLQEARGLILEVGCGASGLARWSPRSFVGCDRSFADYADVKVEVGGSLRPVKGDVCSLPFRDGAFEVVLCMDTLEHLPAALRQKAVHELCRVARTRLILAFPWGEGIAVWDRRLADRLRRQGRQIPFWLTEHLALDPPDPEPVMEDLRRFGFGVSRRDGAAGVTHYLLMRAEANRYLGRVLNRVSTTLSRTLSRESHSEIGGLAVRALVAGHALASRFISSRRAYRTYLFAERQVPVRHPRTSEALRKERPAMP